MVWSWIRSLCPCCPFSKGSIDLGRSRLRRIYIGSVPVLGDDDAPEDMGGRGSVGSSEQPPHNSQRRKSRLDRISSQSFSDMDYNPGLLTKVENPVIPVRRQSIMPGDVKIPAKNVFPNNEVTSSRYTILSFLPKNVYEQFRRIVNFYFLVVAIIQSVTSSPVSPVTSIAPLAFVVIVTMIKQGYEDWLRHKADNLFNNRPVKVIRDGVIELIHSRDVKVGDIVKLEGEEQVPTDIVLLGSSDEFQRCLLNTANLDGETSLKMRYVPAGLPHFRDESDFLTLDLIVECEEACEDLYRFNGNILIPPDLPRQHSSLGTIFETVTSDPADQQQTVVPPPPEAPPLAFCHALQFSNPQQHDTSTTHKSTPHAVPEVKFAPISQGKQRRIGVSEFNMIFLGMENVILRGTKVKNTDFVYGVVVYTGPDTRLARNSKQTAPKFSTVEKTVNKYLYAFILILLILVITATLLSLLVNWVGVDGENPWYLQKTDEQNTWGYYFQTFSSFLILFNYIIPISLYVTMEMQKFIGSKFFVWDEEMSTEAGEPPLCNTSDLNEELGQIEYLFSDKTGTLTENVMKTRMFSVDGRIYEVDDVPGSAGRVAGLFVRDEEDQSKRSFVPITPEEDKLLDFCRVLALCHSIQIMPKRRPSVESGNPTGFDLFLKRRKKKISSKVKNANSLFTIGAKRGGDDVPAALQLLGANWEFQGSSPDEKALVETCVQLNVCYDGEKEEFMSVNVCGQEERYKRHMMLEFDADRKCMSVIVENEAGDIWIMTKGAETSVIPRCDTGPVQQVNKHVLNFAMMGYRTLVIARRRLTKDQLDIYLGRLRAARRLVENRDEVMKHIYRDVESHLEILGATGVEDQLQEGVVETLHSLGAAGIRVWVLTGDKVETATAVAYSCGLMTSFSKQLVLTKYAESETGTLIERLRQFDAEMAPDDNTVLIMDGETIEIALRCCPEDLCSVAMKSFRVVCCRMTPLQKSQVVKMVKDTPSKPLTAAVGDGANDVAMIQEAHIGIGIIGKEGRQAARCADFALARFGFLQKAILVHGHWYYVRLANLANYFFYKNIIFVIPQVLYCFSSGFSTQPLFDSIFLMMYNIFYTAFPILIYGLMEQPHPSRTLQEHAYLYKDITSNRLMTPNVFLKWLVFAIWHAFVCYYTALYAWPAFHPLHDISTFGTLVFSGIVAVANMKLAVETVHISWIYIFSHVVSYLAYFTFSAVYSEVDLTWIWIDPKQFRSVFFTLMAVPVFWVVMILVTSTAIIPDIIWKGVEGSWTSVTKFFRSFPKFGRPTMSSRTLKKSKSQLNVSTEAEVTTST